MGYLQDTSDLDNLSNQKYLIFLIPIFGLFIGCSEVPTTFGSNEVSAQLENNGIEVSNDLNQSIYYFAAEQEFAARALWDPASVNDQIQPSNQVLIEFSDIHSFKRGDKVIFYYWETDDPSNDDIQSFVIST